MPATAPAQHPLWPRTATPALFVPVIVFPSVASVIVSTLLPGHWIVISFPARDQVPLELPLPIQLTVLGLLVNVTHPLRVTGPPAVWAKDHAQAPESPEPAQ